MIISERFFRRYSVKVTFKKEDNTEFSVKAMVTHQSKAKGRNQLTNAIKNQYDEEENLFMYVRTKDAGNIEREDIVTSISIETFPNDEIYIVKDKYRMVHINGKPEFYIIRVENFRKSTFGSNGINFS